MALTLKKENIGNSLETRRKKDSYELRRNDEVILYFRKDIFPRWIIKLFWGVCGGIITVITTAIMSLIPYLLKMFTH